MGAEGPAPAPREGIRFGIHAGQQYTTFTEYLNLWRMAEELGFEWGSCYDHLLADPADPEGACYEGLTLLSALAAHTKQIACGILVVGVSLRHPGLLAKMATTIDHVSGGRMELGIGAAWYKGEHQQYGLTFRPYRERVEMVGETAKLLKSLWTRPRTTYEGDYFSVRDAIAEPKPLRKPHVPLWIGGDGDLLLRVVAESADGWNVYLKPPDAYEQKLKTLSAFCQELGRPPGEIRKSLVIPSVLGEDRAEILARAEAYAAKNRMDLESLRQSAIVGTPEECVERLLPFLELGVSDFIFDVDPPGDRYVLELIAGAVAPRLKAAARPPTV